MYACLVVERWKGGIRRWEDSHAPKTTPTMGTLPVGYDHLLNMLLSHTAIIYYDTLPETSSASSVCTYSFRPAWREKRLGISCYVGIYPP